LQWSQTGMAQSPGRSLTEIFRSEKSGRVAEARDHVLIGRERQDVGRPNDAGYPVRGIVTGKFLFLHNFAADRWPSGNPETGYLDCDGGPTKTNILTAHRENPSDRFWQLCFGMRGDAELFDLTRDPDCLENLAQSEALADERERLQSRLFALLKAQGDPRMVENGKVFDAYPYANRAQANFYERFMRGEKLDAGWVNQGDFEKP
jgi:N-sulfoglucosamine sulfohydrolase